jgi:hypothetical protein
MGEYDPDFTITVDGDDVTKYVFAWHLTDTEDGISTLKVKLMNPDQVNSNKFDTKQKITIIFGYEGNMGESITMTVQELTESYSVFEDVDFITLVGMDCMADLSDGSESAGGGKDKAEEEPFDMQSGGGLW